ncbi:MAG TPA: TadE/TadG family type IV pilus assembly protein [Novosphingobium sp.]|nr:TadE/TadG family type IV pilus assembly protein [Novosphingobium sp.]
MSSPLALLLARCRRAAAATEFALLAPVFLLLLFGTIEYCRLMWITQAANEVAYSAARCLAYGTSCSTSSTLQSYVVSRAAGYGVTVSSSAISYSSSTTCYGTAGSSQVQFTVNFNSPLSGFITSLPSQITATGCFLKV